jgi:lipoate-protein ligase A
LTAVRFLDLTLPTSADNLALDEALLVRAELGEADEVLRVWEWHEPAVILGSASRLADDVDVAACEADGVPILRRSSGGGTVLLGAGCLLFSLVLRYNRNPALSEIRSSYAFILGRLAGALDVERIACAGTSDLTLDGRKLSGNSQQRKRHFLLHHGTLLYAFDLSRVGRYLLPPPRQPEYRAGRKHTEFLTNLPLSASKLKHRLRSAWGADEIAGDWPVDLVQRLVREKYGRLDWSRRR